MTWTSIAAGGASGNSASGSGSILDTVDMPDGSSIVYTITATVDTAAQGILSNVATVTPLGGLANDTDATNNQTHDGNVVILDAVPSTGLFNDNGQSLGSAQSSDVKFGDLNGDGHLDAFVTNYGEANKVWLNDGSGTFTDSGQSIGSANSWGASLADLDNDGDLDAIVANSGSNLNKVWLNNGSGVFSLGQPTGSTTTFGVDTGDLDGDGDIDVFLASTGNRVWFNDGSGILSNSGQSMGSVTSLDVSLGDVDGDGDLDAFIANYNQANKVWLNDGNGGFTDSGQSMGSAKSWTASLADLDGDGDLDAFVSNTSGQANTVWLNNGSGIFTDSGQALGTSNSKGASLGDLDGDGDLDSFVTNFNGQANKVWLNNGSGTFTDSGQSFGSSSSRKIAIFDVDGDGDLDAFVANWGQANKVWINQNSDIIVDSITAAGDDQLVITYTIENLALGSFDIGIYQSDNTTFGGDTLLDTLTISAGGDLTAGQHVKSFTIGTDVMLPGYGAAENNNDYYILAVADPTNSISETDADPFNEDNTAVFDGIYHDTNGDIFVHGDDTAETIIIEQGSVKVTTSDGTLIYAEGDVAGFRVRGHGGDDIMEIDLFAGKGLFVHGGEGSDKITVHATAANDTATLRPGTLVMSGTADVIAKSAEEILVYGNGGTDTAKMYDSSGNNKLVAKPTYSWFKDDGLSNYVNGFSTVDAYATAGGIDTANLFDSSGNDTHTSYPTLTRLRGTGFNNSARQFEIVSARSTAGGTDKATFYDSSGTDTFIGSTTFSRLFSVGFSSLALGFDRTEANSSAGSDRAKLFGSNGDDIFIGRVTDARLIGTGFDVTANNFGRVDAYAQGGTNDRAYLFDSSGNDVFTATETFSVLGGSGFANYARGFDRVDGYASTGNDKAKLYDSSGADGYIGRSNSGTMIGTGFKNVSHNFDSNDVYFNSGGTDITKLFDSAGSDTYFSTETLGVLAGTGFKHTIRDEIETIEVFGGTGGTDTVNATDIKILDTVFGSGNLFRLTRDAAERIDEITDFNPVNATAATNHAPTSNVGAASYAFNKFGTWDANIVSIDFSTNNPIASNDIDITKMEVITVEGLTLPGSTVTVARDGDEVYNDGTDVADSNGFFSIDVTLLHNSTNHGANTLKVRSVDTLVRTAFATDDIHYAIGTVVRFDSNVGTWDVELLDDDAPITVANFLGYSSRFENSIIHRSPGTDFVIQGGVITMESTTMAFITPDAPILNEFNPANSNVAGTLSMALGADPNGGTSSWFINSVDNSGLDASLHTVFGRVVGTGMDVVTAIDQLSTLRNWGVFGPGDHRNLQFDTPLNALVPFSTALTGTVSVTPGSQIVTGTNTLFTQELIPTLVNSVVVQHGSPIKIGLETFIVGEIISDTELKLADELVFSFTEHLSGAVDVQIFKKDEPKDNFVYFNTISTILTPGE